MKCFFRLRERMLIFHSVYHANITLWRQVIEWAWMSCVSFYEICHPVKRGTLSFGRNTEFHQKYENFERTFRREGNTVRPENTISSTWRVLLKRLVLEGKPILAQEVSHRHMSTNGDRDMSRCLLDITITMSRRVFPRESQFSSCASSCILHSHTRFRSADTASYSCETTLHSGRYVGQANGDTPDLGSLYMGFLRIGMVIYIHKSLLWR